MGADNAIRIVKTVDLEGEEVYKAYDYCYSVGFDLEKHPLLCKPFLGLEKALTWATAQTTQYGIEYFDEIQFKRQGEEITRITQLLLELLKDRTCYQAVMRTIDPYNHSIEIKDPHLKITIQPWNKDEE